MFLKLICLVLGFICGYYFVSLVPIKSPFVLSEYIAEYLLNPFIFFAIMIFFFIGFLVNAYLIRSAIEETIKLIRGEKIHLIEIFISYSVVGSFYTLFQLGFWQTLVLLSFSLIYGIISLDIKS